MLTIRHRRGLYQQNSILAHFLHWTDMSKSTAALSVKITPSTEPVQQKQSDYFCWYGPVDKHYISLFCFIVVCKVSFDYEMNAILAQWIKFSAGKKSIVQKKSKLDRRHITVRWDRIVWEWSIFKLKVKMAANIKIVKLSEKLCCCPHTCTW